MVTDKPLITRGSSAIFISIALAIEIKISIDHTIKHLSSPFVNILKQLQLINFKK